MKGESQRLQCPTSRTDPLPDTISGQTVRLARFVLHSQAPDISTPQPGEA